MDKPNEDVCGCCRSDNRPLRELAHLIAMLERREAERKEREKRQA